MTLDELRDRLRTLEHLPGSTLVVLAEDTEGNGFSPLHEAVPGMYLAETSFSGEHYPTEEQRLAEDDPDEYAPAPDEAVPAVFLWPTN
jgi:hypothetical protein